MDKVLLVVSLLLLGFFCLPFYIDLYKALKGQKTDFDSPEFIGWKLYAIIMPLVVIFIIVYGSFH